MREITALVVHCSATKPDQDIGLAKACPCFDAGRWRANTAAPVPTS